MTNLAASLVQNLKNLNAKERDHLMRFAYLGATQEYEKNEALWLSDAMKAALEPHLSKDHLDKEEEKRRCVFAGMDYHLDWLYAALIRTCKGEESGPLDDGSECSDDSLRPIIGIQEDLDLLVVYADDQNRVEILCIEAKGDASFNKVQLARKLTRLDRIFVASGAKKNSDWLKCKFLLIAPKAPSFSNCLDFVKDAYPYLANESVSIGRDDDFFVPLKGFPESLTKVTRTSEHPSPTDTNGKRTFTHWKITKRPTKR